MIVNLIIRDPYLNQHLHEHESLVLGFMLANWLQAMGGYFLEIG